MQKKILLEPFSNSPLTRTKSGKKTHPCLQLRRQRDLARRLGQLQPLRVSGLKGQEGWRRYEQAAVRRGTRLGDIKPGSLDTWDGWEDVLGDLVEHRVVCESW